MDKFRLKKLKTIVFDLDGTLLNDRGEIDAAVKELITELREKFNIHFTFASGRLHSSLFPYAEELKLETPIISLDGCLIKNYPDGEVIYQSLIKPRHVKKTIDFSENLLLNVALCHENVIYFTEKNSVIPQLMEKYGAEYKEVNSYDNYTEGTLEVVFASDSKENLKYVHSRMDFPYSWGLNTSFFKSQFHSGVYYLEIRRAGSSKGKGLLKLLKHLKLKESEAAVVGDWYNDRTLFETKALGVAVANAVPEIKRIADYITEGDNNTGGVSEFLEKVLNSKKS